MAGTVAALTVFIWDCQLCAGVAVRPQTKEGSVR